MFVTQLKQAAAETRSNNNQQSFAEDIKERKDAVEKN